MAPVRGIAGFACRAFLDFEDAKIAELDTTFVNQRFDDGVECLLDNFLRLELRKPNLVGDGFDDFFLGHDAVLL